MTLQEIAERVVTANKTNETNALLNELYADDAVSVEAFAMDPNQGRAAEGLDAIRGKHAWWDENMTVHSMAVEGPFLHGEYKFACIFAADATDKTSGKRAAFREVAIYTVKDEKIVREEFFYAM
ncbi:MAG: SnoaL-like domain-containing protein [Pseudomonadota bacterium]